ncbi:hypothetical protein P8452_76693 [Trifolium repens]|nr:hypothetical protein P8452_76693 [Trifolium repens]
MVCVWLVKKEFSDSWREPKGKRKPKPWSRRNSQNARIGGVSVKVRVTRTQHLVRSINKPWMSISTPGGGGGGVLQKSAYMETIEERQRTFPCVCDFLSCNKTSLPSFFVSFFREPLYTSIQGSQQHFDRVK